MYYRNRIRGRKSSNPASPAGFCRAWLIVVALALSLSACTVSYNVGRMGAGLPTSEIARADERSPGTRVRSTLAEGMIRIGLIHTPADLADVGLGFTVVDSLGHSIPYANVVVDLDTLGRMQIGRTNESGQITLTFSEELILRDPIVFGEQGGRLYGVTFNATASVDDAGPIQTVDLSTLEQEDVGQDVLYFSTSVDPRTVDQFAGLIRQQHAFIRDSLGLAPIPWGMALVDAAGNLSISPPTVQREGRTLTVFPFALRSDDPASIAAVNLHEWVEQTLDARFAERLPRWIADGLAEHAQLAFYRSRTAEERTEFNVTTWFRPVLKRVRERVEEAQDESSTFDLLTWRYADEEYTLDAPTQWLGYRVAASFWYDITTSAGSVSVREFLTALPDDDPISSAEAIRVLNSVIGQDYSNRLQSYPLADVLRYFDDLEVEIIDE